MTEVPTVVIEARPGSVVGVSCSGYGRTFASKREIADIMGQEWQYVWGQSELEEMGPESKAALSEQVWEPTFLERPIAKPLAPADMKLSSTYA